VERTRDFGEVFLAMALWKMLELDEFFERILPAACQEVPMVFGGLYFDYCSFCRAG